MLVVRCALAASVLALAGACTGSEANASGEQVPLEGLHRDCSTAPCLSGQTCVTYFGVAGPKGPRFSTCEIPCATTAECPSGHGLACTTISDGPGKVCD